MSLVQDQETWEFNHVLHVVYVDLLTLDPGGMAFGPLVQVEMPVHIQLFAQFCFACLPCVAGKGWREGGRGANGAVWAEAVYRVSVP